MVLDSSGLIRFDATLHCMCTNRTRARRMAEVSRFKKCNLTGSKKKVCLQELRQTSMFFSGTSDPWWPLVANYELFQRLLASCQLFSMIFISMHIFLTLLNSLFISLFSSPCTPFNSCWLTSPQFHMSIFSQPSRNLVQANRIAFRFDHGFSIRLRYHSRVMCYHSILLDCWLLPVGATFMHVWATARSQPDCVCLGLGQTCRLNMPGRQEWSFYAQKLSHKEAFAHGKLLHRGACTERIGFTQRSVYTEKVLHTENFHTREPFDKDSFKPSNVLHTEAFTQSSSYTEKLLHRASLYTERLLHRDAFTQITWYPEKLLQRKLCHREAVTQRYEIAFIQGQLLHKESSYTEKIFYLNEALTQRSFYTEKCDTKKLLHRDSVYTGPAFTQGKLSQTSFFTQGSLYTEKLLRREPFIQKNLYTEQLTQFSPPKPDLDDAQAEKRRFWSIV